MTELTTIDIGIPDEERAEIVAGLERTLADTYTLYLMTHGYHWNVTGPLFNTLHLMFEEQYNELWMAIDVIAERIRSLGAFAPGTGTELAALASIEESSGVPSAEDMLARLTRGHETVARTARTTLGTAERAGDQPTADLLTARLTAHEKTAWMLRSMLA